MVTVNQTLGVLTCIVSVCVCVSWPLPLPLSTGSVAICSSCFHPSFRREITSTGLPVDVFHCCLVKNFKRAFKTLLVCTKIVNATLIYVKVVNSKIKENQLHLHKN